MQKSICKQPISKLNIFHCFPNMKKETRLSVYKTTIIIGASFLKRVCWYFINVFFFKSALIGSSAVKIFLLKLFGAKIGKGINIKPAVNIKYPWKLSIGDHCWIGEGVWIDNLDSVTLHNNVCISQGAMLLTGNHDYKKSGFDLILKEIVLEDGVWIGAQSLVCPGVTCYSHAVLSAKSVATRNLDAYTIYQGNPAVAVKERVIE
jgi:putative colanic acid biosynthesis acetyltransferase WcaF